MLRALATVPPPAHDGDGFWVPLVANIAVPRWCLVVLEIALVLIVIARLVLSREGLLGRAARTAHVSGAGLWAGVLCYAFALGGAIVLERIVARGHPAPWLHAPRAWLAADVLVLVGLFVLATRAVARIAPWRGQLRYLAPGAIVPCVIGFVLLLLGAAELAWLWLVPAASIAIAPRWSRVGPWLAIVMAVLPIALVLRPAQLREAAWNGFLPLTLPLAIWLSFLGIPAVCVVAWQLRRRRPLGPVGSLLLGVGGGVAVIFGVALMAAAQAPCSYQKFSSFGLACERV
jgi:hypothetical protein